MKSKLNQTPQFTRVPSTNKVCYVVAEFRAKWRLTEKIHKKKIETKKTRQQATQSNELKYLKLFLFRKMFPSATQREKTSQKTKDDAANTKHSNHLKAN